MNKQKAESIKVKDAAQLPEKKAKESDAVKQEEKHQEGEPDKKLNQFAIMTLDCLAKQDEKIMNQYADDILNAGFRDFLLALLEPLITNTESMDNDEKKYWRNLLPTVNDSQVKRLFEILFTEKVKLLKLEEEYKGKLEEKYK
ncbi:MAG: hypothetical protein WCI11_18335 [Candidatus Methylumidiphilus sp.]